MSRRNGERARFHINRKRKLLRRVRIRAAMAGALDRRPATSEPVTEPVAEAIDKPQA